MRLVRCISERKGFPGQIEVGKKYWIDDSSSFKDSFGNEYALVYLEESKETEVGMLDKSHFETVYRYLNYGGSLSSYVNTHNGFLLKDIINWCLSNSEYSLSGYILRYVSEYELNISENMEKEFVVNHVPFKEYVERGMVEEYEKYMGYYLYCID